MGINQSKDSHTETRSSSSSNSSGNYKLFSRRSGRPLFKTNSTSFKEDQEHKSRQAALKAFKDKQALKKQQKLDKKKRQQQQQLEQQYKHHQSSSTTTNNSYGSQHYVAEQQTRPLPTPPSSHHQHRPTRRLSYSTDSISSGKSSHNTHQSSGKSGSSFHEMTLEERLSLLNLTGVRGSPSAEKTAYSRLNFVGDEQEINRQLRYHYVLKQVMGGNLKVDFIEPPEMILDSACGAGFWSLDIGQQFPDCQVVAMDIVLPTDIHLRQHSDYTTVNPDNNKLIGGLAADGVPNVTYIHGDLLSLPLQFGDNTFDLIYQREAGYIFPSSHWGPLIQDFYRLLKPNGMVQLVEYPLEFPKCGPLSDIVNNWVQSEATANGLNTRFIDTFEKHLNDAGFSEINTQIYEFPIGEWPTDESKRHQGFLQKELSRLLLKQSKPHFSKILEMESDVYDQFVAAVMNEFEENHGTTIWKIVTAKKNVYK